MSNPKAPRVGRSRSEVQSDLDSFVLRLRRLGASADEITAVQEGWDHFDDDWTRADRDRVVALPDDALLAELQQTRQEHHDGTVTPEDDARAAADARAVAARQEADRILGGSVHKVLEWVGDDPDRARAVIDLETPKAEPRKTLIEPLQQLLDAAP